MTAESAANIELADVLWLRRELLTTALRWSGVKPLAVAHASGVSVTYIYHMTTGRRPVNDRAWQKLRAGFTALGLKLS